MLRVLGHPHQSCQGWTRRDALRVGGAGLFGASLPMVQAAEAAQGTGAGRAKSVIFVFPFGGPSQLETFDMKPEAPSGIRGPFMPIACRTPGLQICEHLPHLAAMSDKFAVVRTMTHKQNDHNACHLVQTGHDMPIVPRGAAQVDATEKDWPAMGSVVEYLDQKAASQGIKEVPSYVYLPNRLGHIQGYDRLGQYAGWLGRSYDALATEIRKKDAKDNPYFRTCTEEELDFRVKGLSVDASLTLDRLDRRNQLLTQFDTARRQLEQTSRVVNYGHHRDAALAMLTAGKLRDALDIRKETPELRDRYGRHLFGQAMLMGRRMVEAGARFVTVLWDCTDGYSWDSHIHSHDVKKYLLPGLDQSLSALLEDLQQRGLLEETLVVCAGEMGRTPLGSAAWGRQHWSFCFPALFAGAGIRGGMTYGRSDKDAGYPVESPVTPQDFVCTIYDALGIDPYGFVADNLGRPVPIMDSGRPLTELFG
jgi:uncharacterized protein (DUF1501 family)